MSLTLSAPPSDKSRGVGIGVRRIDGADKVTGRALYAADQVVPHVAYGMFALSTSANCRINAIDSSAAEKLPGVLRVITHESGLPLKSAETFMNGGTASQSFLPLQDAEVRYEGQQVAFVIADTPEAAAEGAKLVRVEYGEPGHIALLIDSEAAVTENFAEVNPDHEDASVGDPDKALEKAAHRLTQRYTAPTQHHNPIETYNITVHWQGDRVTVYEPSQYIAGMQHGLARLLDIPPENVHFVSPFVGGAFGCKATLTPHAIITAFAARELGRPLKVVIPRDQMFTAGSYRAMARFDIDMACDEEGKLSALKIGDNQITSRFDPVTMNSADIVSRIYRCPNIATKVQITRVDTPTPGFMRAPAEVPGMFALESAIDELAEAAGLDPIEFRIGNEPEKDPVKDLPFSSRHLVECYRKGAEMFGWKDRPAKPKSVEKDGSWVGYGCATSLYPSNICAAAVKLKLDLDGKVEVQSAFHDLGTGGWTVLGQIASEFLGVPLHDVTVGIGDSQFPAGPIAGGSTGTASLARAVADGCEKIKAQLFELAVREGGALEGEKREELSFTDGKIESPGKQAVSPLEVMEKGQTTALVAQGESIPKALGVKGLQAHMRGKVGIAGSEIDGHVCSAWGAQFVEVHVDRHTREIRVPRITGVFAAGQILNRKAGLSQLSGGMIWGIGSALHEITRADPHLGKWVNKDLAEYLVPVNADVRDLQVETIPEEDKIVNPLSAKGIGELGIVGTNAALANAVYNAVGIRVRDLPITLDKLI